MSKTILIDPVTRIEGHSKITIQLDDHGAVDDAHFHVTQYRGFEKMIEGRPFYEMPAIMGRICGICTVSHELASAQACEAIMSIRVMGTAANLRRIVNLASLLQSHALSFFYLSSPDFLLGMESDIAKRSLFGLLQSHPEIAKDGVYLRRIGQSIIERIAGRRIHPDWIMAGGAASPLDPAVREAIIAELPEAKRVIQHTLDWFKRTMEGYQEEIRLFGNFPTAYLALMNEHEDLLELYRGRLRMIDTSGNLLADFARSEYQDHIAEKVEPWSYLKSPYYKPMGYPDGIYRVGPLARLNIRDKLGTPEADQELLEFKGMVSRGTSSFYFHYARLIEMLFAVERIGILLDDPDILSKRVLAKADANVEEGVGVTEAPRGTLIHHYKVDEMGRLVWANLVVSTTHNNLAMNRAVQQVARRYIDGTNLTEGMLNRVEAVIRTFDPCLSCSTHAQNQLALDVELRGPEGELLDRALRG